MRRALLGLIAAGLVIAPAAHAAGSPATRAEANRLALLNLRFDKQVQPAVAEVEEEIERIYRECSTGPSEAPDPEGDDALMRQVSLYVRKAGARLAPRIDRFNARLDAFRTRDFRLRRTARAIAAANRKLQQLSATPVDPCTYFEQWKASGWASDFRIQPPVRNFSVTEVRGLQRQNRIIRSGFRHMRKLGVSRSRTERLLQGYGSDDLFGQLSL